jgi:lipid-A-disaccharide synthase
MKLMMVAGELSGDTHGGSLLQHLKASIPGLEAYGVGGRRMMEAGLRSLLPIADLQARGLVEVLAKIPRHFSHLRLLENHLDRERPDAVLLIDYPGFNLRVAKAAKARGLPVIYYSGPQLWAWRGGRMRKIVRVVDKMIVLFPFEVPLYRDAGVDAVFLGHPLVGVKASAEEVAALREQAALEPGLPVVGIMPGSRPSELLRNLPPVLEGLRLIAQAGYRANYVLPVAATLDRRRVEALVDESGVSVRVCSDAFLPLLAVADLAIVASGTATLQVAMAGIPFMVVYRLSPLSYHIIRRFLYIRHASIVNILAQREIAPEILQRNLNPDNIRNVFLAIARDAAHQQWMRQALAEVTATLGEPGAYQRAATVIADYLRAVEGRGGRTP